MPLKGFARSFVVHEVVRDLKRMGDHGKVVVRIDQENSIVDLFEVVAKARRGV